MILDLESLVKLMKFSWPGSWMSNGRSTLTKWMLVRRYEVHDASHAGLREKGLLVEVDDPGVVLQDVLVLLQAVLQGSRLHKRRWRLSAIFAVRSSSKAAFGIKKILWILAPEITFGQRKVVFNPCKILSMNDDDGLRIDLALRMLFCFGVLPIQKPHSRLSCHDKVVKPELKIEVPTLLRAPDFVLYVESTTVSIIRLSSFKLIAWSVTTWNSEFWSLLKKFYALFRSSPEWRSFRAWLWAKFPCFVALFSSLSLITLVENWSWPSLYLMKCKR